MFGLTLPSYQDSEIAEMETKLPGLFMQISCLKTTKRRAAAHLPKTPAGTSVGIFAQEVQDRSGPVSDSIQACLDHIYREVMSIYFAITCQSFQKNPGLNTESSAELFSSIIYFGNHIHIKNDEDLNILGKAFYLLATLKKADNLFAAAAEDLEHALSLLDLRKENHAVNKDLSVRLLAVLSETYEKMGCPEDAILCQISLLKIKADLTIKPDEVAVINQQVDDNKDKIYNIQASRQAFFASPRSRIRGEVIIQDSKIIGEFAEGNSGSQLSNCL